MEQPSPQVSRADVERIVRRDFPVEDFESVLMLLDEYQEREKSRVQLAVLKLADGKKQVLRREIEGAKYDWRDVLGPAEYPEYSKKIFRIDGWSADEKRRVIEADWKQYSEWLYR